MFVSSLRCAKIRFNTVINPAFHAQDWTDPKKGSVRQHLSDTYGDKEMYRLQKKLKWSYTVFHLKINVVQVALEFNL